MRYLIFHDNNYHTLFSFISQNTGDIRENVFLWYFKIRLRPVCVAAVSVVCCFKYIFVLLVWPGRVQGPSSSLVEPAYHEHQIRTNIKLYNNDCHHCTYENEAITVMKIK